MKTAIQYALEIRELNLTLDQYITRLKRRVRDAKLKQTKAQGLAEILEAKAQTELKRSDLNNFRKNIFDVEDLLTK